MRAGSLAWDLDLLSEKLILSGLRFAVIEPLLDQEPIPAWISKKAVRRARARRSMPPALE